jgi:hypothetical protein
VSSAGDVNGDGYDDLVAGAPRALAQDDPFAGAGYVIFGRGSAFPAAIDVAQLGPADGFRVEGAESYDGAGYAVAAAGDVNGDGLGDVAMGALRAAPFGYRPSAAGDTYLLFGSETGFPSVVDTAGLGAEGVRLDGGYSIQALSPAGDSDGDGMDELLVGAPDTASSPAVNGVNGIAFRVRGDTLGGPTPRGLIAGSADADEIVFATPLAELIQTLAGDDIIDGGGGDDVILAGAGDDRIQYHAGARRISGGPGFDTLLVAGDLDLADPAVTRRHHLVDGIEAIDLRDPAASVLTLDARAVARLSDERSGPVGQANALVVFAEASDTVQLGPGWSAAGSAQFGGRTFDVYRASAGNTTVWIDHDVGQVTF